MNIMDNLNFLVSKWVAGRIHWVENSDLCTCRS